MSDLIKDIHLSNKIRLRSVYSKGGGKLFTGVCRDKQGRLPASVRRVNSQGDMILTDAERNSGEYFIPEDEMFTIEDGTEFDLDDEIQRKQWDAVKHCIYIAPDRYAKDSSGNYLIDGTMDRKSTRPRYGIAEFYIERLGEESVKKVTKKKLIHSAISFIIDDPKGAEGRKLICRLLGKSMINIPDADVEDYLISIAERDPNKIISLYTGTDTNLRLIFLEAKDKHVIYYKNKLYTFADGIVLGPTDDSVIAWMKNPKNKNILELIKKETYPDLYADAVEEVATDNNKEVLATPEATSEGTTRRRKFKE